MRACRRHLLPLFVAALLLGAPLAVPLLVEVPAATAQTTVAPGDLFVADFTCCGGDGGVIRVDPSQPAGANQAVVSQDQHFVDPFAIVLGPDGALYVADISCCAGGQGGVIRVDPAQPAGANQTIVSEGQYFADPIGIALAPNGDLLIADADCCGSGGVIRVDPSQPASSNQTIVSEGQHLVAPYGIAVAPSGDVLVADLDCCVGTLGGVIRVDPSGPPNANQTIVSEGQNFLDPRAIVLTPTGDQFVIDPSCCAGSQGGVIRVDPSQPATANQTVVSQNQSFLDPVGITRVPNGDLLVTDVSCCGVSQGGVIRVDPTQPAGANQAVVSQNQSFVDPWGITRAPNADLALTKAVSPNPVVPGGSLTYTLTVKNNGPEAFQDAMLRDVLPAGVQFQSVTPPAGGSCPTVPAVGSSGVVACIFPTLPVGASGTVRIVVTVPANTAPNTSLSNTATLTSARDLSAANNTATAASTRVVAGADLTLTQPTTPPQGTVGQPLTYTLTVANAGPNPATGVFLTDTLPSGATFVSATPSQGGACRTPPVGRAGGSLSCPLGTIPPGAQATVQVVVRPTAPGTLTNTFTVRMAERDPTPAGNPSTTVTPVNNP